MLNYKKILFNLISILPMVFVVSCGYKPGLYNYEAYMSKQGIKAINKDFTYKQFGDLYEFTQMVKNNKTVGGIGSDYVNAKLAKEGYLQKINFKKLFPKLKNNKEILNYYTKQAINLMNAYDSYLGDIDNDGKADHLWEYMIPYFIQDKVIAYNIDRGSLTSSEKRNGIKEIKEKINKKTGHVKLSWEESLKVLKNHGYNNIVITDAIRDNLMLGSSEVSKFTGKVTSSNYVSFIKGFKSLIKKGMNIDVSDSSKSLLKSSGGDVLSAIIDPTQNWGVGLIYNGDALDAYYAEGNFPNAKNGRIRVIRPINTSYLLDGMVIVKSINIKTTNNIYKVIKSGVYKGGIQNYKIWKFSDGDYNSVPIVNNFDAVNYTPPFKNVYNFAAENYFNDNQNKRDENAFKIFEISQGINDNHITWPISDKLESNVISEYNNIIKS